MSISSILVIASCIIVAIIVDEIDDSGFTPFVLILFVIVILCVALVPNNAEETAESLSVNEKYDIAQDFVSYETTENVDTDLAEDTTEENHSLSNTLTKITHLLLKICIGCACIVFVVRIVCTYLIPCSELLGNSLGGKEETIEETGKEKSEEVTKETEKEDKEDDITLEKLATKNSEIKYILWAVEFLDENGMENNIRQLKSYYVSEILKAYAQYKKVKVYGVEEMTKEAKNHYKKIVLIAYNVAQAEVKKAAEKLVLDMDCDAEVCECIYERDGYAPISDEKNR